MSVFIRRQVVDIYRGALTEAYRIRGEMYEGSGRIPQGD